MTDPLLEVRNLRVAYPSAHGYSDALRGISFTLGREKLGIVGESGSGKSTAGRAIMRLLPAKARVTADVLRLSDVDLLAARESEMRDIRGGRVAMILQDPRYALNPLKTAGSQIMESYRIHTKASRAEARDRMLAMLEDVHIHNPGRVAGLYPHELSGGMGQRVMIAMMLIASPEIVIADEPTSALDVTVRGQILEILNERVEAQGAGLILISHDLPLVSDFCDRVLVMYGGQVMEELAARDLSRARHPYTVSLHASLPPLDHAVEELIVPEYDPSWLTETTNEHPKP
ncbi:ABC transporter ATP-binding protein [Stappia stellulata]|uniref:ABC transporter ATP-binding protein n=1 Tax=Stappia stellulata TaxID=71235 RepID=UPI001CD29BB6|nr:ABC transporter ATP-binding protein [Stappia stellulata]MCA1241491.1 ABC transporter ATP-binding protein [Stappia stellulata]